MKLKILFVLFLVAAFCSNIVRAQDDKAVSIKVTGSGKTPDEAKQAALRSAIEQAFGTFISAKTDILNDQVVSDQITSVSSGNIQKYEVLNESKLPNGGWATTLNATVSVSKLTSFVQAKGVSVDIKGGIFAMNIRQQILNEQGEVKAFQDMIFLLHEPMLQAFDYSIVSKEPKSLDADNKNWSIPLTVVAKPNKNLAFVSEYLIKNLMAICMRPEEVSNYSTLNKEVFIATVNGKPFAFRKQESLDWLIYFASRLSYYVGNFSISSGDSRKIDECNPYLVGDTYSFLDNYGRNAIDLNFDHSRVSFTFPNEGRDAGTFTSNDKLTLKEVEGLEGYSVKPAFAAPLNAGKIKIGQNYAGGTVFYIDESGQHGLVAGPMDFSIGTVWGCPADGLRPGVTGGDPTVEGTESVIGTGAENTRLIIASNCSETNSAARKCADFVYAGYDDWFLPSEEELDTMAKNLCLKDFGVGLGASSNYTEYWSSTDRGGNYASVVNFNGRSRGLARGLVSRGDKADKALVRPVRAF